MESEEEYLKRTDKYDKTSDAYNEGYFQGVKDERDNTEDFIRETIKSYKATLESLSATEESKQTFNNEIWKIKGIIEFGELLLKGE